MRSVPEWIGANDDAVPPPRVRVRVFDRCGGRCHVCGRLIHAGEYWECDHVIALINGGENREKNLAPACCFCCKPKTAQDVAEKSAVYEKHKKHVLPRERKYRWPKRPFAREWAGNVKQIDEDLGAE